MWPIPLLADWRFGAGDPTVLAWAATAGYLLTAMLCVRAALAGRRKVGPALPFSGPWWSLAAIAAALGVNKQLDFQTLFIEVMRRAARTEGWYGERRGVQKLFVVFALATSSVLAWRWLRAHGAFLCRHRSLTAGLALVVLYALLRMASINHVEFGTATDDTPLGLLLTELLGVILLTQGAATAQAPAA